MAEQVSEHTGDSGGPALKKVPTGIAGLDEVTRGGLPAGRTTLVAGGAGCGKTVLAAEFLARGAIESGEAGVFMMFEESIAELTENMRSLGFDLDALVAGGQLVIDHVHVERSEIEETGEYDLEGLFLRLGYAIDRVGARRVVLDTVEALFAGLPNHAILRAELRRLFRWLKEREITALITGERGDAMITRHGLEEYVADCVILLDHRIVSQVSTRRLRVLKYRGSAHGTNEYPFIIGQRGISVLPVTSLALDHPAPTSRVSTGIPSLDALLGGAGVFRGSSVLVSGSAGTGKSTLIASVIDATCRRGERALLFVFEESPAQVVRNMASVGLSLQQWIDAGLLQIHAARPSSCGLEQHLVLMHETVRTFMPDVVAMDPISSFTQSGATELEPTLMRIIDFLKQREVTGIFSALAGDAEAIERSSLGVSALMDTWLVLKNVEAGSRHNRCLHVLKSRGMSHSNDTHRLSIGERGLTVEPAEDDCGPGQDAQQSRSACSA